jgi:hypothetical protein
MLSTVEFLPVREFPDRGTQWLLDTPDNVRAIMRLLAPTLAELMDFTRLQRVRTTFIPDDLRKQMADLLFRVPWRRLMWYLLLLIHHRRAAAERAPLADIVVSAARRRQREEEIVNMRSTIAEDLMREGETRAKQEYVFRVLQARFPQVPETLHQRIRTLTDVERLDHLLIRAATAARWEEVVLE